MEPSREKPAPASQEQDAFCWLLPSHQEGRFPPVSLFHLVLQGWSSAYSIESVIMQISATLVKGKARVQFGANKVRPCLEQQGEEGVFETLVMFQNHLLCGCSLKPRFPGVLILGSCRFFG